VKEFEKKYQDVLHNIEMALVQVYREQDEMTDWEALTAVNGLIRTYTAEQRSRTTPNLKLDELAQEAFDNVQFMCEWRLGRAHLEDETGQAIDMSMEPKTVSEIVACLKRIRKSIEMWQKESGRRGYFNIVSQIIP
jgi:hypothetical protein